MTETATKRRRETASNLVAASAECAVCAWRADQANAQGIAARHHDMTGHEVDVLLTRRVVYGDREETRRASGQTRLDVQ